MGYLHSCEVNSCHVQRFVVQSIGKVYFRMAFSFLASIFKHVYLPFRAEDGKDVPDDRKWPGEPWAGSWEWPCGWLCGCSSSERSGDGDDGTLIFRCFADGLYDEPSPPTWPCCTRRSEWTRWPEQRKANKSHTFTINPKNRWACGSYSLKIYWKRSPRLTLGMNVLLASQDTGEVLFQRVP